MDQFYGGSYPIETRAGEIERLHNQSKLMAPDTLAMLDRFGSMQGWRCLDVGCGPGGITDLLSARVGRTGQVVGLDMDARFLEHAGKDAPRPRCWTAGCRRRSSSRAPACRSRC